MSTKPVLIPKFFRPHLDVREQILVKHSPEPIIIAEYLADDRKTKEEAWNEFSIGVNLQGRCLRYANFTDCRLYHADLREGAKLDGANLFGANLFEAKMNRATLEGAIMSNTNLQGASLRLAQLKGAKLISADLQGADLTTSFIRGGRLFNANLQGVDLTEAFLEGSDLSHANLQGAELRFAHFDGADLQGAYLQETDLEFAHFEGADLKKANLQGANLRGARLQGADLSHANLTGSFMEGMHLAQADLRYARLDSLLYLFPPDTLISPSWDRLIGESRELIPMEMDMRAEFVLRLETAKARAGFIGVFPEPDLKGYLSVLCDSLYPLDDLLFTNPIFMDDSLRVAINCQLLQTLSNTCADRWKNRVNKLYELESLVSSDCACLENLR